MTRKKLSIIDELKGIKRKPKISTVYFSPDDLENYKTSDPKFYEEFKRKIENFEKQFPGFIVKTVKIWDKDGIETISYFDQPNWRD